MGEVLPAGAKQTRFMIVGSLLHRDCIIRRLQENIEKGKMDRAAYRQYPILDKNGNPAWPGKFPDQKAIEEEKTKGIDEANWRREYLLEDAPNQNQIILEQWFKEYAKMPNLTGNDYIGTFNAVDPSGSDDEKADLTAIVTASVFGRGKEMKIYIHPDPINKRMRLNEIKDTAILLSKTSGGDYHSAVIVEDVGVQKWLAQELKDAGVPVREFKVAGMSKAERLTIAASPMQAGKVLFPPKDGISDLRLQLLGFGREKHDDLADAFAMLILEIMKDNGHAYSPFPEQGQKIKNGLNFLDGETITITEDDRKGKPDFAGILDKEF